jgi:hypothetical protein
VGLFSPQLAKILVSDWLPSIGVASAMFVFGSLYAGLTMLLAVLVACFRDIPAPEDRQ